MKRPGFGCRASSARHCRRYGRRELITRLQGAGYKVEFVTEFMASILPVVWAGRKLAGGGRVGVDA